MQVPLDLPEPWVEVEHLPDKEQAALEATIGSRLTYDDLAPDEVRREGADTFPNGARAMLVMGHQWVRLRNADTDTEVIVRLQYSDGDDQSVSVSSVVVPFDAANEPTGAMLRTIPVAAIGAAYTRRRLEGTANLHITLTLGEGIKEDPLAPLPAASGKPEFAARVARQYLAVERAQPDVKPVDAMRSINDAPLSTVQRWVTRARKYGFLPPSTPRAR